MLIQLHFHILVLSKLDFLFTFYVKYIRKTVTIEWSLDRKQSVI